MTNEKIRKGLFVCIFVVLLLPFSEQNLGFITSGELLGNFTNAPDITFSWDKWFDGSYQKAKAEFCNDHTGFRPDLVRQNNQADFSLFGKIHANWMVLGRDNYLYQHHYIDAYLGEDFVGYDIALEKSRKLKAIQDTLARLGKSLILVFAPCKAFYYPEYFPKDRDHEKKGISNFEAYTHIADSLGINQVDLNTWFMSMKNKSRELLFSKQGIHWTVYGSLIGGDSLIKYIEKLRHIRMPHPVWTSIEHTNKARDTDDDIARELNLIFPMANETFSYPEVHYIEDTTKKKPNAIYMGDSFGLNLIENGIIPNAHANWEYWFYFAKVLNRTNTEEDKPFANIENYDWKGALGKTDCVIIVYTTYTLSQLGHGFIEQAYDYYYPKK